ncbi:MAG: HAMP domain-containing protein, partial [Deltaproteobacteria bacterium]|nr:HAMP domain-containing protein [Deltaproteobacteria bacterium]
FDIILERFFGIRTAGNYIQVLDPYGAVVAKSSNLEGLSMPLLKETYTYALQGVTTFEVVRNVGRYPVRLVTKPIFMKGQGHVAIVQVASSLDIVDETFHSLAYIFAFGMAGSAMIASAVGWFLASMSLKPVAEIAKTARRIGAESLNERINVKTPQDEIGVLAATINEMIARLEKSFKQIKQFTADASHELKTPLTILKGEMEVALRSNNNIEDMRQALMSSLEEIDRMSYMVRNLLDLAKIDADKESSPKALVSLDKALTERFEHFRRLSVEAGVEMRVVRNSPASVYGDPVRISQLIYNLVDNAIKYTRRGGRVDLSIENDGSWAIVRVKDTGVGISMEDLPYIFDRFYRVDKARGREVGGAGLGLSICKEIAESLKGVIEADSEYGRGTTFTVRLPLAKPVKAVG